MNKHYSIELPTKRYLKKYLEALYGNPIIFTQNNFFGMAAQGYLNRRFYLRHNEVIVHRKFDKYDEQLCLLFPAWWQKQSHFGLDFPKQNIIYLNKLFETRFDEDVSKHCISLEFCGIPIKQALEDICLQYGIEIPEDITYDALRQKEYRYRKNNYPDHFSPVARRNKSKIIRGKNFF